MALSANAARGLRVDQIPQTVLYKAAWIGGGELPDVLKGTYTSRKLAEQAIENFLDSKRVPAKSTKSAKSTAN